MGIPSTTHGMVGDRGYPVVNILGVYRVNIFDVYKHT